MVFFNICIGFFLSVLKKRNFHQWTKILILLLFIVDSKSEGADAGESEDQEGAERPQRGGRRFRGRGRFVPRYNYRGRGGRRGPRTDSQGGNDAEKVRE